MGDVDVIVTLAQGILDDDDFNERSTKLSGAISSFSSDDAMVAVDEEEPSGGEAGNDAGDVTAARQKVDDVGGSDAGNNGVVDGNVASVVNLRKKKQHRRGKSKKRKWKPYNKLTWEEKRELEDRETRRAQRVREERFAHGQPVAPYNTTQFLMEDRIVQEPDLEHSIVSTHRVHRESGGTTVGDDSDEYYYSSPEDEEEFLQKEFSEVYDNIHAERLGSMTKLELIQEYMLLEERVDKLENKLSRTGSNNVPASSAVPGSSSSSSSPSSNWDSNAENNEKIRIFKQEIRKLAEENECLRRENEQLMKRRRLKEPPEEGLEPHGPETTTESSTPPPPN